MSEIRTDTISAANGTDPVTLTKQSAAKAFGYITGLSALSSPSLNISSTVDLGSGKTGCNFTNSFSSDKTLSGMSQINIRVVTARSAVATASYEELWVYDTVSSSLSGEYACLTVYGDLA